MRRFLPPLLSLCFVATFATAGTVNLTFAERLVYEGNFDENDPDSVISTNGLGSWNEEVNGGNSTYTQTARQSSNITASSQEITASGDVFAQQTFLAPSGNPAGSDSRIRLDFDVSDAATYRLEFDVIAGTVGQSFGPILLTLGPDIQPYDRSLPSGRYVFEGLLPQGSHQFELTTYTGDGPIIVDTTTADVRNLLLNITAIPEPSTAMACMVGGVALTIRRRGLPGRQEVEKACR